MKQRFVPFGTVSSREEFRAYDREYAQGDEATEQEAQLRDDATALFHEVIKLVEAFDIDDGVFFLAWEIASLPPALTRQEQKAVLMLVLCTLIALRQGSTCLPLEHGLLSLLKTLVSQEVLVTLESESVEDLHALLKQLLRSEKLRDIVADHGDEEDYKPLIIKDNKIYHQRMLHYEQRLIDVLSERLLKQGASIQTDGIEEHLEQVWQSSSTTQLTAEQRYAVLTSVHLPLTIITGGPGTGKTSIVVAILRLMTQLGVQPEEIALAAPTGKAANRMLESIESQWQRSLDVEMDTRKEFLKRLPSPQTVHRMLGYSGQMQHYHHQEYNPLHARVVIVDEASMIDIFLMERLVRALRPDAHLILLGDADQLPSVEAGSVLRDMTAQDPSTDTPWRALLNEPPESHHGAGVGSTWTVKLTKSHRMRDDDPDGRSVLHTANAVRDGDIERLLGQGDGSLHRRRNLDDIQWRGAEWLEFMGVRHADESHHQSVNAEQLRLFLQQFAYDQLELEKHVNLASYVVNHISHEANQVLTNAQDIEALRKVMAQTQRSRLLTLTRVYPTGTRALNRAVLELLRRQTGARATQAWLPGSPVMMLRNDYEREIFNGDQGIVMSAWHHGRQELMVFFPRGESFVAYNLESLRSNLDLSFAMTVHKSQGSEFERVALILPEEPLPLLTREVIYTAITRSKKGAIVVGSHRVLEAGVTSKMKRFSALGDALLGLAKSGILAQKADED